MVAKHDRQLAIRSCGGLGEGVHLEKRIKSQKYHQHELIDMRQRGRVVSPSDSQSSGPVFESRSGHWLDLFSVVPSSNPRQRL